jgi:hypothetical protein
LGQGLGGIPVFGGDASPPWNEALRSERLMASKMADIAPVLPELSEKSKNDVCTLISWSGLGPFL